MPRHSTHCKCLSDQRSNTTGNARNETLPQTITQAANSRATEWRRVSPPSALTFLGLLLGGGLGGHVDGGGGHGDGAAAGHQVQLHRLAGDEGGGHLHLLGQAEVGAEAGHEVPGGDEVHAGLQGLQDQLEAAADLLLGDAGHGADLCGGRSGRVCLVGLFLQKGHLFVKVTTVRGF